LKLTKSEESGASRFVGGGALKWTKSEESGASRFVGGATLNGSPFNTIGYDSGGNSLLTDIELMRSGKSCRSRWCFLLIYL
jgi:hypothetical protein